MALIHASAASLGFRLDALLVSGSPTFSITSSLGRLISTVATFTATAVITA